MNEYHINNFQCPLGDPRLLDRLDDWLLDLFLLEWDKDPCS